eukprot:jgi/Bigna1/126190/aug1.2_g898
MASRVARRLVDSVFSQLESRISSEFDGLSQHRKISPKFVEAMEEYERSIKRCLQVNRHNMSRLLSPTPQPERGFFGAQEEEQIALKERVTPVQYYGSFLGGAYGSNDSLMSHVAKDWSTMRPEAWTRAHQRIIERLEKSLRDEDKSPLEPNESPSILVPGCGVGRLVFDIGEALSTDGEESFNEWKEQDEDDVGVNSYLEGVAVFVHGTESSMACLRVIDKLFNTEWRGEAGNGDFDEEQDFSIYPFIGDKKNNYTRDSRLAEATVLNAGLVGPSPIPRRQLGLGRADISFSAMSLAEMDRQPEQDAVVTCFYLDCHRSPLEAIELIYQSLRPGGVWINLGPLSYHHPDGLAPTSKELSIAIEEKGFVLDEDGITSWEEDLPYYIRPKATLKEQVWRPIFFVARRK